MHTSQAVVVLSCGGRDEYRNGKQWDPTDEALARVTEKTAQERNLPIYGQWEVVDLIDQSLVTIRQRVAAHRTNGKRLDTREGLEQIFLQCKADGISEIILVAQPIHYPRASMAAKKLGFLVGDQPDTKNVPLDPLSKYPWVCSELRFKLYERCISTPMYRLRGWI